MIRKVKSDQKKITVLRSIKVVAKKEVTKRKVKPVNAEVAEMKRLRE